VTRQQTTTEERQNLARQFESELANQKVAFKQKPITTCYLPAPLKIPNMAIEKNKINEFEQSNIKPLFTIDTSQIKLVVIIFNKEFLLTSPE